MGRADVELGGVCPGEPESVAGVLDGHHLHTKAQAEARDVMLTAVPRSGHLAFDPALAEPTRNHDAVEISETTGSEKPLDLFRLNPLDLDVGAVMNAGMVKRLDDRQIGVGKRNVLANHADTDRCRGLLDTTHEFFPGSEIDGGITEPQDVADVLVEALVVQHERNLVETRRVGGIGDTSDRHIAEIGDLAAEIRTDRFLRSADDRIGLNTPAAQFGDGVLGRLGLHLARRTDERHQRDMDVADIVAADVESELTDRLKEGQDLNVAHRAADLGDDDVDVVAHEAVDPALDLVGDVGDHLHRLAEIVTTALSSDDRAVDRAGRPVGVRREVLINEPLVVPEVEIGFAAVVGDEHLAVFEGVHRSRIDIQIRVELLHGDAETAGLEEAPKR